MAWVAHVRTCGQHLQRVRQGRKRPISWRRRICGGGGPRWGQSRHHSPQMTFAECVFSWRQLGLRSSQAKARPQIRARAVGRGKGEREPLPGEGLRRPFPDWWGWDCVVSSEREVRWTAEHCWSHRGRRGTFAGQRRLESTDPTIPSTHPTH